MNYLLDRVTPSTNRPSVPENDSEYVKMQHKSSRNKLKKPHTFSLKQVKFSWSTSDLSKLYSNASTVSPQRPNHQPHEDVEGFTRLGRPTSQGSPNETPLPELSSKETYRKLLNEKLKEQLTKQYAVPQVRYVYGFPGAPVTVIDVSNEPHADYRVCVMPDAEAAVTQAQKYTWAADKARGVHFESVLRVRRKQLEMLLQKARKANMKIEPTPPRQKPMPSKERCKNCSMPLIVVPPGLNSSDWLPLVYLSRARRCERQRPNPEDYQKSRAIVLNRMINENAPRFGTWPHKRDRPSCPGPSPLSNAVTPEMLLASTSNISPQESEQIVLGNANVAMKSQLPPEDADTSESSSEYSDDQTETSHENFEKASVAYQAIEVRGLNWVKKHQVPQFHRASRDRIKSFVAEIASLEEEPKVPVKPLMDCNRDKPLPPLPAPSPPQSPILPTLTYPGSRFLRRSQSMRVRTVTGQGMRKDFRPV